MRKRITIHSMFKSVGTIQEQFDEQTFANETMLFSAHPNFANQFGGTITKTILSQLDPLYNSENPKLPYLKQYPNPIIDTRVHMLMPGMYPAIPGWHLDHTPRAENGQPIPEKPTQLKKAS